jgi:DNA gyrase subunit B
MFETTDTRSSQISQRLRAVGVPDEARVDHAPSTSGSTGSVRSIRGRHQSFVRHLNRNKEVPPQPPDLRRAAEGRRSSRSRLQYNDSYTENVLRFANNINTVDGGTHVTGFRAGADELAQRLGATGRRAPDADGNLSGDDVREGLTAVISVKLTDPQFEGQTKAKLGNAEVKGQVQTAVADSLGQYLDENPADGRRIIEKCLTARPSPARRRARRATSSSARVRSDGLSLPGKLADCQERDPGAQRAVHRRGRLGRWLGEAGPRPPFQAILPIAGKLLNVEKARARQDPLERERPAADHRARRRASATASTSRSCATTGSSS